MRCIVVYDEARREAKAEAGTNLSVAQSALLDEQVSSNHIFFTAERKICETFSLFAFRQ